MWGQNNKPPWKACLCHPACVIQPLHTGREEKASTWDLWVLLGFYSQPSLRGRDDLKLPRWRTFCTLVLWSSAVELSSAEERLGGPRSCSVHSPFPWPSPHPEHLVIAQRSGKITSQNNQVWSNLNDYYTGPTSKKLQATRFFVFFFNFS